MPPRTAVVAGVTVVPDEVEPTEAPELTVVSGVVVAVEVGAASEILVAIRRSIHACCASVNEGRSVSS